MIPSIDTRLASMASAVAGVIRPALGEGQPFASEQAALLLAHLQVLRAQEPMTQEFEQLDYNRTRAFAHATVNGAGTGGGKLSSDAVGALRGLLEAPIAFTIPGIRAAQDDLARGIGNVIEAVGRDGSDAAIAATQKITIDFERAQSLRYRSYFSMMGYEDGSTDIAKPEAMMAELRGAYGATGK